MPQGEKIMVQQSDTAFADDAAQNRAVLDVPLNRLKKSPRNARRVPHAEADIEALAASIAVKDVISRWWSNPSGTGRAFPPASS
jgi:ParB family chromosome partitioning protein